MDPLAGDTRNSRRSAKRKEPDVAQTAPGKVGLSVRSNVIPQIRHEHLSIGDDNVLRSQAARVQFVTPELPSAAKKMKVQSTSKTEPAEADIARAMKSLFEVVKEDGLKTDNESEREKQDTPPQTRPPVSPSTFVASAGN